MKETFYFSHDYGARNDPKLVKLQMKLGHEGKGLYWDIVEMLYEQSGFLLMSEIETYSFELRSTYERITDIIQNYELFKNDGEKFWSESVLERLKKREIKSQKARESVGKRWNNTNVIRTKKKRNTIKESKIKEIKEEEIQYSEFYKTELEKTKELPLHENYKGYVSFLYGKNDLNLPLTHWLKIDNQLTYEQYCKLFAKSKEKNKKLKDLLYSGENKPKWINGNKTVFGTLNTWLNRD
jgi:hypothetical protein